jgi:hypothetical protein
MSNQRLIESALTAKGDSKIKNPRVLNKLMGHFNQDILFTMYPGLCQDRGEWLRLSQLGKPAVLNAVRHPLVEADLSKYGLDFTLEADPVLQNIFLDGHTFEVWVKMKFMDAGIQFTTQDELIWNGVPGHLDIHCKELGFIAECKALSSNKCRRYIKRDSNGDKYISIEFDDMGYYTQLAAYRQASGAEHAYWIIRDKGTNEVHVLPTRPELEEMALSRAAKLIPILRGLEGYADIFGKLVPPPGEPEVFKKENTGLLKVPYSMQYERVRHLFYDISILDNGYNKPTQYCGDAVGLWLRHPDDIEEGVAMMLESDRILGY